MSEYQKAFNRRKAIQSIVYLVLNKQTLSLPSCSTIYQMLYFADKLHLEEYGRQIYHDQYYAGKYHPIGVGVEQILADCDIGPDGDTDVLLVDNNLVTTRNRKQSKEDLSCFSVSDKSCLRKSLELYSKDLGWEMLELVQDDAWYDAYFVNSDCTMSIEAIARTCKDGELLVKYLRGED